MAGARAQILPLVGGGHDWATTFSRWSVLSSDTAIAQAAVNEQLGGHARSVGLADVAVDDSTALTPRTIP